MKLQTSCSDSIWQFYIEGEFLGLDAVLLTNKIEALDVVSCGKVVVDISQVTFIESTALGSLIYCHKHLEKRGVPFQLADTREHALDLFRKCPLDQVLAIVDPLPRNE